MARQGRLIVLEGIDGCGSTSQSSRLAESLRRAGREVCLTCEPSRGPIGALIRSVLEGRLQSADGRPASAFGWSTMALLFAADRLDHVRSVIEPALRRGAVVISDRYDLSSLAYQSATSQEGAHAVPWIRELNRYALRPDLTVIIDVSPQLAEQRRGLRGEPQELFEKREIQRRLAAVYRRGQELVPGDRVVHIVGEGTLDEVAARVAEAVGAVL